LRTFSLGANRMFSTNPYLQCTGCDAEVDSISEAIFSCPNRASHPAIDHVLLPIRSSANTLKLTGEPDPNPFIQFRTLMSPYATAMARGMTDTEYVDMVRQLDAGLERLDGSGFRETPMFWHQPLNSFVKVEVGNVAQSHKARHLMNAMLYLLVHKQTSKDSQLAKRRLAVASCGNAGLAAAVVAAAAEWPIDVCIPPDADPTVVARLQQLGASVHACKRDGSDINTEYGPVSTAGSGDPCVTAFRNLVNEHGSIPFSVQGPECWLAVEGGQTLAWEVVTALKRDFPDVTKLNKAYVQVGGGALGAGLMQGLGRAVEGQLGEHSMLSALPALTCVQPEGNQPLRRAFAAMASTGATAAAAAKDRGAFMEPWDSPHSVAYGILDDETYDWVALCDAMAKTGGQAVSVSDPQICSAKSVAEFGLGVGVCHTGSAGLAALLADQGALASPTPNLVILSGLDRQKAAATSKPAVRTAAAAAATSPSSPPPSSSRSSTRLFSSWPQQPQPQQQQMRMFGSARRSFSSSASDGYVWSAKGIDYKQLPKSYDWQALFDFNKTHGSTPLNFIPDEPVKAHLQKIATGQTVVWGAFDQGELCGFITGEYGGGYWLQTGPGYADQTVCFINEFVVDPSKRGKGIGKMLTKMSVDEEVGIFGINPQTREMYTTVHVDNVASRTAFIAGGYSETITYDDRFRDRSTTVLKRQSKKASFMNGRKMRVVGLQSGNAVDGIDVGVFDFEPIERSETDPRALAGPLKYTTIANKTYPFTAEMRNYVLGLRALDRPDGVEYAEGNYKLGDWFADAVNNVLEENKIDKSTVQLIGSHGQSVCGHPHWEFGDLSVIAQKTGITTAGDFRPADVAAGGNGTPCTCTYDSIMLRPAPGSKKWRIAINIGGTSSVTFCPPWPLPGEANQIPLGLDPGLGVFFMDLTVKKIDPSLEFDDDGKMARSGKVNEELLAHFLDYKYYHQELPIGVGAEDFPVTLYESWRAKAQSMGVSDIDLLCTLTELTAKQIALACAKFGGENITNGATDDVVLRGGVCNNSFFRERMKAQMSLQLNTEIKDLKTLDDLGINEDSWENAMYAMLGYLCYSSVYNFVPSCTGASRPVVGGRIAPGENFHSVNLLN